MTEGEALLQAVLDQPDDDTRGSCTPTGSKSTATRAPFLRDLTPPEDRYLLGR